MCILQIERCQPEVNRLSQEGDCTPASQTPPCLRLVDRVICMRARVVMTDAGAYHRLTPTEAALVERLAATASQTVTTDTLIAEVWGYSPRSRTRTVVTTVHRLRRKLEPSPGRPVALLRDREGYRLMLAPRPI